jgi:hypothetical protein
MSSHTNTLTHAHTRACGQMQRSDALIALHITGATSAAAVDRLKSVAL